MEFKDNTKQDLQLKDLDSAKGVVAFYYAPFGEYDNHKDIHDTKAFDNVIMEFKDKKNDILHFRDHIAKCNGYDHNEVPGVLTEMGKDSKGAFAVSKLALKTDVGRDTYEQYEAGIIKQHSYGAVPSKSKFTPDGKGGRILTMREVKEVSSLTSWAASSNTPIISLKSLEDAEHSMAAINHALHHGNITDEGCLKLLDEYKKLKKFLESKDAFMTALENKESRKFSVKDVLDQIEVKTIGRGRMLGHVLEELDLKREFNTEKRKDLAKSGAALPDGSFPIENQKDLENAIHDVGRANDEAAAKAHIIKRAKELGLESILPADWK